VIVRAAVTSSSSSSRSPPIAGTSEPAGDHSKTASSSASSSVSSSSSSSPSSSSSSSSSSSPAAAATAARGWEEDESSSSVSSSSSSSSSNVIPWTDRKWVQCDACSRWRTYPPHVALPDEWTCALNTWNPKVASCAVEENEEDNLYFSLREKRPRCVVMPKWLTALLFYTSEVFRMMAKHKDFASGSELSTFMSLRECELHGVPTKSRQHLAFVGDSRSDFSALVEPMCANFLALLRGWRGNCHVDQTKWRQMTSKVRRRAEKPSAQQQLCAAFFFFFFSLSPIILTLSCSLTNPSLSFPFVSFLSPPLLPAYLLRFHSSRRPR